MKAGGAGREALARGASALLGIPLDEVRAAAMQIDFRGRTDELLIDDLIGRLGAAPMGLDHRLVGAYLHELQQTLPAADTEILPGIPALLASLEQRGDVIVGLLTGNIREAARIKLEEFGLGFLADRPGGFGDDGRERAEVARAAGRRTAEWGVQPHHVVVVGDTEHDVTAARVIGARAVVVATGWTPIEILARSDADLCLPDLSDPSPLLDFLESL